MSKTKQDLGDYEVVEVPRPHGKEGVLYGVGRKSDGAVLAAHLDYESAEHQCAALARRAARS